VAWFQANILLTRTAFSLAILFASGRCVTVVAVTAVTSTPVWARDSGAFLAECRRMRWLNHGSFVLLYFALFAFSGLCFRFCSVLLCLSLSSALHFPAWINVNGTVQPDCADVPLRIYSLTLTRCNFSPVNNLINCFGMHLQTPTKGWIEEPSMDKANKRSVGLR